VKNVEKTEGPNNHKKLVTILLALAAGLGLAGVMAGAIYAAPAAHSHLRLNLSNSATRKSFHPDIAVRPDQEWTAVTWVESYAETSGNKGHVFMRVASETDGWSGTITLFSGYSGACAYDRAAVAIKGDIIHIAYIVYQNDCASPDTTTLYYQTCTLSTGTCGARQGVLTTNGENAPLGWVDIAFDESNNPQLVFARNEGSPAVGQVYFIGHDGSSWGSSQSVNTSSAHDNFTPSIAWSDNCAHIVWEDRTAAYIIYRRRCGGTWSSPITLFAGHPSDDLPDKPDIAAVPTNKVFAVWAYRTVHTPESFAVVYKRSNDGGVTFQSTKEVGTDFTAKPLFTSYQTGDLTGLGPLRYVQPSIALNSGGEPAVAWHTGGTPGIRYTYAITTSTDAVGWAPKKTIASGEKGAVAIEFGKPISPTLPLIQMTYMTDRGGDWDVYYDSNEWDAIEKQYTYLPFLHN
jgi:hypothetical protein